MRIEIIDLMIDALRGGAARLFGVAVLIGTFAQSARGQEPFLSYTFDDPVELEDFIVSPSGVGCGAVLVFGDAAVEDGALVMTNGPAGASLVVLHPDVVDDVFPEERNYRVRMRVSFESHVGNFYIFFRARLGVDDAPTIDITHELGYPLSLEPTGGTFNLIEISNCNVPVPHPEWVPGNGLGAAIVAPYAFPAPGEWFWMEMTARNFDDDGGPVELTASTWQDGENPPEEPQLVVTDLDGLLHTDETRDPAREVQILLLTLIGQPTQKMLIDDLEFFDLDDPGPPPAAAFNARPGDANLDGSVDLSDPVAGLNFLFGAAQLPACLTGGDGVAAFLDANGDGSFNLADNVWMFNWLFSGGAPHALGEECAEVVGECEGACAG